MHLCYLAMSLHSQLEDALSYWTRLLQQNPTDAHLHVKRGMVQFKLARIDESIEDFDQAAALDPAIAPYLWQRGLSYYYVKRYEDGARQFELDLTINGQDVEETVWRFLCIAQWQGLDVAQSTLLPVQHDPRPVLRAVYRLFAGQCSPVEVLRLGHGNGRRGQFYGHLYVGLYWEALRDSIQAQHFLTEAATLYPLDDYMWHLSRIHCQLRKWAYH